MFDRTVRHHYSGSVEVHYYFHADQSSTAALARIEEKLEVVKHLVEQSVKQGRKELIQLNAIATEVERIDNLDDSIVETITRLADQVAALEPTQAALDDYAARLRASADKFASAIPANTQAAAPGTTTAEPAPGSVSLGGGGVAEPPAQTPGGGGSPTTGESGGTTGTTETTPSTSGGGEGGGAGASGETGNSGNGGSPTP